MSDVRFRSFTTVFQSCQNDGREIMKGFRCCSGTAFVIEKFSDLGPLDQQVSDLPAELLYRVVYFPGMLFPWNSLTPRL